MDPHTLAAIEAQKRALFGSHADYMSTNHAPVAARLPWQQSGGSSGQYAAHAPAQQYEYAGGGQHVGQYAAPAPAEHQYAGGGSGGQYAPAPAQQYHYQAQEYQYEPQQQHEAYQMPAAYIGLSRAAAIALAYRNNDHDMLSFLGVSSVVNPNPVPNVNPSAGSVPGLSQFINTTAPPVQQPVVEPSLLPIIPHQKTQKPISLVGKNAMAAMYDILHRRGIRPEFKFLPIVPGGSKKAQQRRMVLLVNGEVFGPVDGVSKVTKAQLALIYLQSVRPLLDLSLLDPINTEPKTKKKKDKVNDPFAPVAPPKVNNAHIKEPYVDPKTDLSRHEDADNYDNKPGILGPFGTLPGSKEDSLLLALMASLSATDHRLAGCVQFTFKQEAQAMFFCRVRCPIVSRATYLERLKFDAIALGEIEEPPPKKKAIRAKKVTDGVAQSASVHASAAGVESMQQEDTAVEGDVPDVAVEDVEQAHEGEAEGDDTTPAAAVESTNDPSAPDGFSAGPNGRLKVPKTLKPGLPPAPKKSQWQDTTMTMDEVLDSGGGHLITSGRGKNKKVAKTAALAVLMRLVLPDCETEQEMQHITEVLRIRKEAARAARTLKGGGGPRHLLTAGAREKLAEIVQRFEDARANGGGKINAEGLSVMQALQGELAKRLEDMRKEMNTLPLPGGDAPADADEGATEQKGEKRKRDDATKDDANSDVVYCGVDSDVEETEQAAAHAPVHDTIVGMETTEARTVGQKRPASVEEEQTEEHAAKKAKSTVMPTN